MSKELQEKAERMIRELTDSLGPIKEELRILRRATDDHIEETGSIR